MADGFYEVCSYESPMLEDSDLCDGLSISRRGSEDEHPLDKIWESEYLPKLPSWTDDLTHLLRITVHQQLVLAQSADRHLLTSLAEVSGTPVAALLSVVGKTTCMQSHFAPSNIYSVESH